MAESFLNGFGFGNGFGNGAGAGTGAGSFLSPLPNGIEFGYGPSPAPAPSAPATTGAGSAFVSAVVAAPQIVQALPAATSTVQSFPDESGSGLSFTNVSVTETDAGSVAPFLSAGPSYGLDPFAGGLDWSGVSAGALAPGSSLSLDFGYDVATTSPAEAITSLGLGITPDTTMAAGVTLTAVETVYNASNQVVGQISVDLTDPTAPPLTATDLPLTAAQQDLHVDVQLTASLSSGAASGTVVGFSDIQQTFGEAPVTSLGTIAVDKQVSLDGVHWQDVGAGNLAGVTVLAGDTLYERVVVSNTGSVALSGVAVSDVNGVPGFTFGGAGSTSLGAGQSITSDIGTVAAAAGSQIDTATATGTFVVNGATLTTTASDQANYTGVTPSITIDKQVSVNGTAWQDVGSGTLNDPTVLAGDAVYERVILVNTGSIAIGNATATDTAGTGSLPDFTFGGAGSVSLGAGQTIVSDVSTLIAQSGYQTDTATVTGTATDTVNTGTVTASDQGDYTGVTGSISIDKQISVNGTTWQDVGDGVLNGPTVAAGSTLYERVLVTDTGPLAISGATVTDVNGPADFTFGGSLSTSIAVGQTVTSDVATVVAQAGYQVDTATVTGAVTIGVNTGTLIASDQADYTGVSGGITIDKQISINGCTWVDVGAGVLNGLTVLAGDKVYERVIVTDTGSLAISGAVVTDVVGATSLPNFTFGNSGTVSLKAGQSVTSNVTTLVAQSGFQEDTATVTGKESVGRGSTTVTSSDQAAYTGASASITIDKQISVDGSTWVDVGSGVLNDPAVAVGGAVYERVIVTDTGSTAITGAVVTDVVGAAKLPNFTFGNSGTVSLTAGQSVTSNVTTLVAQSGHQIDTATVTGTVTDTVNTGTVTASDKADYTGTVVATGTPGISVLKVPSSVVVCAGQSDTYTFYVTNTGSVALTGVTITDNIGTASNPDDVTPTAVLSGGYNVGDTNHNGVLNVGETWQYTETVTLGGASTSSGQSGSGSGSGSDCGGTSGGQSGSGSGCDTGSGYGQSGSGQSGSGSSGSGWGNSGSSGGQSGSGIVCDTGSGNGQPGSSGSGWNNSGSGNGSNCGTGSGGNNSGSGSGGTTAPIYVGDADTITVTATATGGAKVSATDTKEVLVLGSTSSGSTNCGSGDQSGSGGACNTGSGSGHDNSNPGSGSNGWGNSGSGDDQSGSGSNCATGYGNDNSNSGSGSYGSGGNQSGSGSACDTGSGNGKSGSGNDNSGSNCATGSGSDTSGTCGSGITLNGAAPTGNLPTLYGAADTLEFTYNPGNTVSLAAGSTALASVSGTNANSMAFIEISNNANPFAAGSQIYYEGAVQAGQDIFADATIDPLTNTANPAATNHFSTASGAELYGFVFTSQAAFLAKASPVETMAYATGGGHGMSLNDTIGSLKLVGYVGATGGHLVS